MRRALVAACALALVGCAHRPYNVVFIAVDDLRPQLLSYGVAGMHSPSVESLSQRGATFYRAYCQQTLCNPSRSSVLTGMRPDTLNIHTLEERIQDVRPETPTLPEYFKQRGYFTIGVGKVFHHAHPRSWSVPQVLPSVDEDSAATQGPAWRITDVPDEQLPDGVTATHAIEELGQLVTRKQPFFLAVGFSRPHLPYVAPRKYYDLYPLDKIALPQNAAPPRDAPPVALHNSWELRSYDDIPKEGPIPDDVARKLIRGYQASTSYVDAQIGRVIEALRARHLDENTVIIVWGDHGFHLGEHGMWGKQTNFEVAARAPMILVAPRGVPAGRRIDALVEFVDIFPTLVELAGLPVPKELEGTSLVPLLENSARKWKTAAFTEAVRGEHGEIIGRSIRTERYRYTEWRNEERGRVVARELYDHTHGDDENENLAARPGYESIVAELAKELHAGWRAARPR
jgi:arylsulfatase A-like enzyme